MYLYFYLIKEKNVIGRILTYFVILITFSIVEYYKNKHENDSFWIIITTTAKTLYKFKLNTTRNYDVSPNVSKKKKEN